MAFVTLNDGMLLMDGVIFPDKFKKYETSISNEEMYIVIGKFEKRNQQLQLIINQIIEVNEFKIKRLKHLKVILRDTQLISDKLQEMIVDTPIEKNNILEISSFNEQNNDIKHLGYINKDDETIYQLIESVKPSDIRFI